jgi:uncharacterized protein (TIGR02679 family)
MSGASDGLRDPERLEQIFADDGLDWLVERIRQRIERGAGLSGSVSQRDPTPEQRAAYARLFGIPAPSARALSVRLADLATLLRDAGICDDLGAAVTYLGGPVVDRKARRAGVESAWAELFRVSLADASPTEIPYLEELRNTGLLRRLCPGSIDAARELLARSLHVARLLPLPRPTPLANLAAEALGDSHGLDHGQPVHVLVLRYLAIVTGIAGWESRDDRREAWFRVGVIVDELSAPSLLLGLRAQGDSFTAQALRLHADACEPYRLSTRQLLRERLDWVVPERVYVCENPAIVATAAGRLDTTGAPLVCVEGQPATAARLLLNQLATAGAALLYHGDFDWPGVTIANYVMREHGAHPWRMSAADYLAADKTRGIELRGAPVIATWDPGLTEAMRAHGLAVHEEKVVETLVADLKSAAASSAMKPARP